jgi:hypothetical protein
MRRILLNFTAMGRDLADLNGGRKTPHPGPLPGVPGRGDERTLSREGFFYSEPVVRRGRKTHHPSPLPGVPGRGDWRGRRGAAIVFALIALLVASMMMAALLQTASMSHRQFIRDEYRVQACFLADAGCLRGERQLKLQPGFTGELWTVSGQQLGVSNAAEVRISVTTDPAKPDERLMSVVAEYPVGHADLVRVARKVRVP